MSYKIEKDKCEGISDCVKICPVNCIFQSESLNIKFINYYYIDEKICTSCGKCLEVCPVDGAIIPD